MSIDPTCKICSNKNVSLKFDAKVLSKYNVHYYSCNECGFIFTEKPYWLNEAYESAITFLDLGLVKRNIEYSKATSNLLFVYFKKTEKFLDFGGGYGLFVRMMRDKGFNYFRQDLYCQNLFANGFDVTDSEYRSFDMVSCFELFEHLENPINEIENLLKYSSNILFSTVLIPETKKISNHNDWWYFSPEIGQHIAFYTKQSLMIIAKKYNLNYYNSKSLHFLTKKKISPLVFKLLTYPKIAELINLFFYRKGLLEVDYNFIKDKYYKSISQ